MLSASSRRPVPWALTRAVVCALWAISALPAAALDPAKPMGQYLADFWTESSGLPQDYVLSLLQTRDGYLWVGTRSGLARFDGVRFTVFDETKPKQLKDSEIWGLASGEDSSLWIATYGGGLSHLKDGVFTTYSIKDGLPSNQLNNVAVEPGGTVWAGSADGLARLEGGRFVTFTTRDDLPSNNIVALHADTEGVVWVGTDRGLASISDGRITNHARTHPGGLDLSIAGIAGSGKGGVWLACRGSGLRRFAEGRVQQFTAAEGFRAPSANALFLDERGTLWIGTTAGLWRYSGGRFETSSAQLSALTHQRTLQNVATVSIPVLIGDREGSLWIGTRLDGLGRLRNPVVVNVAGEDVLGQSTEIRVLHEDAAGAMWIGTTRDLRRVEGEAVTVYPLPQGVSGEALGRDREGTLLVGYGNGLARLRGGRVEIMPLGGGTKLDVALLFSDSKGNVWIGTRSDGAYRLSDGQLTPLGPKQGLLGNQVRGIAEDSRGSLWIGTRNGGVSRLRDGKIETFGPEQGLPSPAVQAVYVDRADSVWVCTRLGLARIKDGNVATVVAANGLPANYFYQIAEDDEGYLWLTFARGIVRVSRKELDAVADKTAQNVTPRLFGMESGMASTMMMVAHQPTAWKSKDGRMWFVTSRGVAVIDPRALHESPLPPTTHVEELRSSGEPQVLKPGMVLAPSSGDIEIQYTGLSFLAPERLRFKYRLEGFEEKWQDAGARRVAYYTKLPPGTYRFRVMAATADGVASEREAELAFQLLPHWYQTRWWYALVSLVALVSLAGLAFGFYRWRVRAFEAQQRALAEQVEARTADLQQEVAQHQRTEERLQQRSAERERAEKETALIAERLSVSNSELERENDQRRRAVEEARQAERVAGRERDLLHALMNNTPDLIYFKDREGRFTRINKAHAEALGLGSPEQAVGRSDADFHEPEFVRQTREDERRLIATGQPLLNHVEHDAKAGRWYLATKVPLSDETGAVTGLVGISKDITERKESEDKLERDLEAFLAVVEAVAHGDLTRRGADGSDTLGRIARAVNRMLDSFASILTGVRDAAFSVSASADEILASSTQIAKGAQYGTEQVHTTSSAAGEMSASMAEVLRHAEQSAEAAQQVLDHVREGEVSVAATAQGMGSIDVAVSATAEKMHVLEVRSKQIFEIISLLEDIASQSTLLSLNAAIEAAHAGDAGRGFGVVAEEIRRLADRSRESTKAVTDIVEGIVEETKLVLEAMEHGVREVHAGRELSERAQASLERIQELVERSASLAGHISSASREQSKATLMVSTSLQGIADVTEQSLLGANETSAAVRGLVGLAEQLTQAISQFKVD